MKQKTALVTGGAGFIGSHLVTKLVSLNFKVKVLDNFSTGNINNIRHVEDFIEIIEGDVRDIITLTKITKGIDVVFHLAALPSVLRSVEDPSTTHEVNATGTLNTLIAVKENKVPKFIYSSSSSVYGNTPMLPKIETMPLYPQSPYAVQKLTGENYTVIFGKLYRIQTFSLRYFNVYGPKQNPNSPYSAVIPKFFSLALQNKPLTIFGDGEQTRDFTFVEDAVDANIACLDADEKVQGEVYNIAGGANISINRLANLILDITGKKLPVIYLEPRKGDVRNSLGDISKAKKILNWSPKVKLVDGLKLTFDYYKSLL